MASTAACSTRPNTATGAVHRRPGAGRRSGNLGRRDRGEPRDRRRQSGFWLAIRTPAGHHAAHRLAAPDPVIGIVARRLPAGLGTARPLDPAAGVGDLPRHGPPGAGARTYRRALAGRGHPGAGRRDRGRRQGGLVEVVPPPKPVRRRGRRAGGRRRLPADAVVAATGSGPASQPLVGTWASSTARAWPRCTRERDCRRARAPFVGYVSALSGQLRRSRGRRGAWAATWSGAVRQRALMSDEGCNGRTRRNSTSSSSGRGGRLRSPTS